MRAVATVSLLAVFLVGACGAPDAPVEAKPVVQPKAIAPSNPHVGAVAPTAVAENPHAGAPGMGFMPDYEEGGEGLRIAEVRPGGAAAKCGLLSGDVITKFGGLPVRDVNDYMAALGTVKVGDKIQIEIKRGAEAMKIDAEVGVSTR